MSWHPSFMDQKDHIGHGQTSNWSVQRCILKIFNTLDKEYHHHRVNLRRVMHTKQCFDVSTELGGLVISHHAMIE